MSDADNRAMCDYPKAPCGECGRPTNREYVPACELVELIEEWRERGVIDPYGMTWLPPADELESVLKEHTNE